MAGLPPITGDLRVSSRVIRFIAVEARPRVWDENSGAEVNSVRRLRGIGVDIRHASRLVYAAYFPGACVGMEANRWPIFLDLH